jgi:hypothetical protein
MGGWFGLGLLVAVVVVLWFLASRRLRHHGGSRPFGQTRQDLGTRVKMTGSHTEWEERGRGSGQP